MNIKNNIQKVREELKNTKASLVAVSKTKPDDDLLEAYNAGILDFGENKVQELCGKYERLPKEIRWHMIGHLQRNKVKYIAPFVHLIHAVDSLKLLKEINKQGLRNNRTINCLLQIHIAQEEHKFGFSQGELVNTLKSPELEQLYNIKVCGLMGMASNTDNLNQVRQEFAGLAEIFDELKLSSFLSTNVEMTELSIGMTGDYKIAIEEGSTMVRIGSAVFGARNYGQV